MEKFTSYNYRKIINLVLLLLTIGFIIIASVIKNTNNKIFWVTFLSSANVGTIFTGISIILSIIIGLISVSFVLRKYNHNYFITQALLSIFLIIILVLTKISNCFATFSIVLICLALVANILATVFHVITAKYCYDELYGKNINIKKESANEK